ncbi:MAG: lysophospholipid acyltransferase family protein [Candidatus Thermoplasmatota archaeon]|nr:lysophospholipid acyltransferase family protein [Candidatus Thermoplasmatota archaeon]MEC9333215.1 lysophospholipid acyltransferase family protein [Candidatus Thermoplasmatota archaeon]MEE3242680.1 lysophospholipid acyltransferase family protein [Candidatus Thermoplasmatota archaeon]
MWLFELLYFFYFFLRLRLEVPYYSQEDYRKLVTLRSRKLAKRYNMRIHVKGTPQPGFLAANHTSYLDPIVVQAIKTGGAVSKVEVKGYFLFGPIATKVGMLWVRRENRNSRTGVIQQLNQWDAVNDPLWIFPEGTTSSYGKLNQFKMGVFKAAEKTGHMIQPLVFCYDNPLVDWGNTGKEKDLFKSILDFYKDNIRTNVYCFWMEPMKVGPGEAQKVADELHRRMLLYINRFERPRDG